MHTSTVPHTRTHTSIRLRRLGSKAQGLRELLVRWLIRSSVNVREMGQPQIRRFPFHAAAPTGFNLDSLVLIPMRACPCKNRPRHNMPADNTLGASFTLPHQNPTHNTLCDVGSIF